MKRRNVSIILLAVSLILTLGSTPAAAHCDGMDGPVVQAGQRALEAGNVNFTLIWVQKKDEAEVAQAFQKALAVRKLSPEAKELADRFFLETLVRVHRAGEGAPYTGLQPAGRDLGPAFPAADKAVQGGSFEPLRRLLAETLDKGLKDRFQEVVARKDFKPEDVEAGREFVGKYVVFIHYAEGLYRTALGAAAHGGEGAGCAGKRGHEEGEAPKGAPEIPEPQKGEHEELHQELVKVIGLGGTVAEAARVVAHRLHAHFPKEEKYAMPPLGLLRPLADGKATPEMRGTLEMTDRLGAELPAMLEEHAAIVAALQDLVKAAAAEGKPEAARFAEKLIRHARTEEQVLYPAAILVGEALRRLPPG